MNGETDKDKKCMIYLQYTWNGKIKRKGTGVRCRFADWNQSGNRGKGELRATYGKEYVRDNAVLQQLLTKYDNLIKDYFLKYPDKLTFDAIKEILEDKPIVRKDGGRDFVEYAKSVIESRYRRNVIRRSRYENHMSSLNIFGQFLRSTKSGTYEPDKIYLSDISTELIDKLIKWRREVKMNSDETINHALTPILNAVEEAALNGYIPQELNARLQDMRIIVKPPLDDSGDKEFDGKYLTEEQLKQLVEAYDKCKEVRRKEYLEMFLFAFHACGLRVVDVMTLQWGHIDFKKRELRKVLIKTQTRHVIPLNDAAITILEKWKSRELNNRYVFGLLDDGFKYADNEEGLYKKRNTLTKSINQSIRVVGEQIQLPFPLTMHVARHTFAVYALNHNTNLSVISRLLGHASTEVTEKVYAQFLNSTLTDEVERLKLSFLPTSL